MTKSLLSSTAILLVLGLWPAAARAAGVPAGAKIRIDRAVDLRAFERSVLRRYHVTFRRVVAADIDRDGDVDVIGSTDRGLVVWVNDGRGHLTSQSPSRPAGLDGAPGGSAWSEDGVRCEELVQNELPSPRQMGAYAHAPPDAVTAVDLFPLTGLPSSSSVRCRTPRAPPLFF